MPGRSHYSRESIVSCVASFNYVSILIEWILLYPKEISVGRTDKPKFEDRLNSYIGMCQAEKQKDASYPHIDIVNVPQIMINKPMAAFLLSFS